MILHDAAPMELTNCWCGLSGLETLNLSLAYGHVSCVGIYLPLRSLMWVYIGQCFLDATKQLYEWFSPSVRHTSLTMFPSSYHHEIFWSYYLWQRWRQYKRSRSWVKVTEVKTQLSRFRTVTPVWIHIWWWNDAQSSVLIRICALLFSI